MVCKSGSSGHCVLFFKYKTVEALQRLNQMATGNASFFVGSDTFRVDPEENNHCSITGFRFLNPLMWKTFRLGDCFFFISDDPEKYISQ